MTEAERYLAVVTVVAFVLYLALVSRRRYRPAVDKRALPLSDVAVLVLAGSAATRNTFGLDSGALWLGLAWTIVASCALARLLPTRKGIQDEDRTP